MKVTPDAHGDWLKQRDLGFEQYLPLADKSGERDALFAMNTAGVKTNRDAWCWNFSQAALAARMQDMIAFYNDETTRVGRLPSQSREEALDTSGHQISWSWVLRGRAAKP